MKLSVFLLKIIFGVLGGIIILLIPLRVISNFYPRVKIDFKSNETQNYYFKNQRLRSVYFTFYSLYAPKATFVIDGNTVNLEFFEEPPEPWLSYSDESDSERPNDWKRFSISEHRLAYASSITITATSAGQLWVRREDSALEVMTDGFLKRWIFENKER